MPNKCDSPDIKHSRIVLLIILLTLFQSNYAFSQIMSADTVYNGSFDWVSGQREALPKWIFAPLQEGRVIGVSDPCMKPEAARMLALQRAAYLYSLQQGARLRLLSDIFSTTETATNTYENQRNKMLALGVIEQPVQQGSYRIENEYTSMFGEKFLQVSFTQSNDSCDVSYHSMSELMFLFTKERVEEEEVRFNLLLESVNCMDQSLQSWYQIKGALSSPKVFSCINGVKIHPSQKGYWYENINPDGQANMEMMDMRNAFWNAYMASFVKALLLYPFSDVNVKQVDDRFNGNHAASLGLYREKVIAVLLIHSFVRGIRDNKLCVDWQITEQQK